MAKKNILFVCGGVSGEHEISLISTKHVLAALDRKLFNPQVLIISKSGQLSFLEEDKLKNIENDPTKVGEIKGEPVLFQAYSNDSRRAGFESKSGYFEIDTVFSILHGVGGEDGCIQGFFETAGIPIVGSGVKSSANCMDKAIAKAICHSQGLPVVPFQLITEPIGREDIMFPYPIFVKPAEEGSSLGVSKANSDAEFITAMHEASRHSHRILIEPAIVGRELEVAVLDDGEERVISPVGEIKCTSVEFYSYEAKYVDVQSTELIAPAPLEAAEAEKIQELASDVFDCLECSGLARVDFFQDEDGNFLLNEVNTMPGFTPISMYPRLLAMAEVDYSSLITRLIESASKK